jgi:uncharacterized protein YdeI (BOF family)
VLTAGGAGDWAGALICAMKARTCLIVFSALLLAGCSQRSERVLGRAPEGAVQNIAVVEGKDRSAVVTVEGVMIEKCPVAGCWFNVRDSTGTIKVDTKTAGFVVLGVPLQTRVLVSGRLARNGSETVIEATGLRY